MTATVGTMLETIYASLADDNNGLDGHIEQLKGILAENGEKSVVMNKERLPYNNRQGRKLLQSYFKKRGVEVDFAA